MVVPFIDVDDNGKAGKLNNLQCFRGFGRC